MSKYFHTQVKELGKPTMSLFEPDVTTKKATFGMSWFWFPEAQVFFFFVNFVYIYWKWPYVLKPNFLPPQFGCAKGVIRTRVGYAGGSKKNPTYYSLGDHTETIGKSKNKKKDYNFVCAMPLFFLERFENILSFLISYRCWLWS